VTVCSSTDGDTCTSTPWEQGWIVFSDPTAAQKSANKLALRVPEKAFLGGDTLNSTTPSMRSAFNREGLCKRAPGICGQPATHGDAAMTRTATHPVVALPVW